MCVWVNTGTLYSLTIPAEKKNCCTPAMFFFSSSLSFSEDSTDFYCVLLHLFRPSAAAAKLLYTARHFLCALRKKKYVGRAAMGTVFIFKPCPVSNIYYASKAHKCKNNLSFFFRLYGNYTEINRK
jgi:hypothetical protein